MGAATAVFTTDGKLYRAAEGDVLRVEKLDVEKGATVAIDQVMIVGEGDDARIGTPTVTGGKRSSTCRRRRCGTLAIGGKGGGSQSEGRHDDVGKGEAAGHDELLVQCLNDAAKLRLEAHVNPEESLKTS